MSRALRVGIIGCGLIGSRRAQTLSGARLVACADLMPEKAQALAAKTDGCTAFADWRAVIADGRVDVVFVATLHDSLAEITLAAVEAGKHVLVEKPAARRKAELLPVAEAARKNGVLVRTGFNHRYHRALRKARGLVDQGALGELMFVRGRYGHGGRPGYDREWRADPRLSGGGELIDQGPHLIDLARWFLGDFVEVQGSAETYYWDMPVDDNAFMLLRTSAGKTAFLQVSCTEWKNLFSLEIFGKHGKLAIDGLGGSYGTERIAFYRMLPEMGPPETTVWEFPMADDSWSVELSEFLEDIRTGRQPQPGLADACAVLDVIAAVYGEQQP